MNHGSSQKISAPRQHQHKMKRASKIRKLGGSETANNSASLPSASFAKIFTVLKYAGIVLIVVLVATYFRRSQLAVQDLSNSNIDVLKDAIFGDMPYLFYCAKGTKDEKLPSVFTETNAGKGATMGFAKINCSMILPSGKNLWERFKLNKKVRPTILATAPWMKPQQVAANHLKDITTLTKYIDISMAPKPTGIKTDKELQKFCGFDKNITMDNREIGNPCIVILHGNRFNKVHTDLEKRLILQYPYIHFASIDANKKRLSLEESNEYLPVDTFGMKLYAIRNGTHYITMINPATWDYLNTFLSSVINTPLYSYTNDNIPIKLIKPRSDKKTKTFKKRSPPTPPSYKTEKKTENNENFNQETIEETTATTAEIEMERRKKEQKAREQMEKAAKQHVFNEIDDEQEDRDLGNYEEGDLGNEEEEEEDDGVIEL